jgi:SAM-dependent methyltransferase
MSPKISLWPQALRHRNLRRIEECATLIRWLDPKPGQRILDIGCGDGYFSRLIAEKGADVVGIDASRSVVAKAERKNRTPRTEFHAMRAEDLNFPDSSFDQIISFCVIEHCDDDALVFCQIARLLKPGGRLVLSADSLSNPGIEDKERDVHRNRYRVNSFYTAETLDRRFAEAGFRMEQWQYVLTTRFSLALARATWRLDDLSAGLRFLKIAGHALAGTAGYIVSAVAETAGRKTDGGLMILAAARKP